MKRRSWWARRLAVVAAAATFVMAGPVAARAQIGRRADVQGRARSNQADGVRDRRAARGPHRNLMAPAGGRDPRLVRLLPRAQPVKAGDVVMEFDPADQQLRGRAGQVRHARTADAALVRRLKADTAVQAVPGREWTCSPRITTSAAASSTSPANEFISAIDAQKNVLTLEEARPAPDAARTGREVADGHNERGARGGAREEQQGRALDEARTDHHRQPDCEVAPRRRRRRQGQPRRRQDFFFGGMVLPEYREGDTTFSGTHVADVIEAGKDGGAREGHRDRPRQPAVRPVRDGPGRRPPGTIFSARVGALTGSAVARQLLRDQRGPPVRHRLVLRRPRPAHARRLVAARRDRRPRGQERAARAAPGGLRQERQDLRLSADWRPLRSPRREGRPTGPRAARSITGLNEGDVIALVDPDVAAKRPKSSSGSPCRRPPEARGE